MLGKYIKKNLTGSRYAVGDIHGCYQTFRALVEEKINLTPDDQLFLLGDYINRGTKSKEVIDYIMSLASNGYSVYPLRGNHEQMLINDRLEDLQSVYQEFFTSLLHYYETSDFYFVHATLNFQAADPLEDSYTMLWERHSPPDLQFLNGKRMIHGHTIHTLTEIQKAAEGKEVILPLDNGCYKGLKNKPATFGNLCGLNLDTFKLFVQPNIDG